MTLDEALPEIAMLGGGTDAVRIPPDLSVPLSPRVRLLIDTPQMRRLSRVSQLGLVAMVYPGATHSRFEHSLGVYRLSLEFLARLAHDRRFVATVPAADAPCFVLAALLHDLGHWAFCHPIEDMALDGLPTHETMLGHLVTEGEVAEIIRTDWGVEPQRVADLVAGRANDPSGRLLSSLLSGPVDVDKMDYLVRDSLHVGVPYGRHFDEKRLLSSLCVDPSGEALGIGEKGRSAAELLVMARTTMFSEVYWHHTVRSATAMLQRAVWILRERIDPLKLVRFDDREFIEWILTTARGTAAEPLVAGLFGPRRRLLKRLTSFDAIERPEVHRRYSGRPFGAMVSCSRRLAEVLSAACGVTIGPDELLIDAPPVAREVEFRLQVERRSRPHGEAVSSWRPLADISPLVRSLAHEQFDNVVKRVRIFCPSAAALSIQSRPDFDRLVADAALVAAN